VASPFSARQGADNTKDDVVAIRTGVVALRLGDCCRASSGVCDKTEMSTSFQAIASLPPATREDLKRLLTGIEAAVLFACALLDIWRWQYSDPHLWIAFLPTLGASHVVHRDTLADLGLGRASLGPSARLALPLMLALYLPLAAYGLASGRLHLLWPHFAALTYFLSYGAWCVIQQYLTQSYFHNRLMRVIRNRHISSALVGVMFGAAHIPNPVLMPVTAIAGFIFSEIFARHRNIWPLALAQTVGGFLVAAVSPAWLIHNMRVGPGYYFWGLR
jgi:Type II CAAX prenyl endopeptidase Rce1-like